MKSGLEKRTDKNQSVRPQKKVSEKIARETENTHELLSFAFLFYPRAVQRWRKPESMIPIGPVSIGPISIIAASSGAAVTVRAILV